MFKSKLAAGLLIGLLSTASANAGSISFFLDQSNKLADGVNYLMVTISDERKAGVIDFTVVALQPLLDLAGENFGIHKFAFNVVGGTAAEARNVTELPSGWRARNGGRMSGFGLYDIRLIGTGQDKNKKDDPKYDSKDDSNGNNSQNPLTFSISGVNLDTILSYVDLSTGRSPEGFSFFSAHVIGLNLGDCAPSTDDGKKGATSSTKGGSGSKCVTSAFFGGNTAVPAPPAVWLLGTAVAGLVVRRFRRSKQVAIAA